MPDHDRISTDPTNAAAAATPTQELRFVGPVGWHQWLYVTLFSFVWTYGFSALTAYSWAGIVSKFSEPDAPEMPPASIITPFAKLTSPNYGWIWVPTSVSMTLNPGLGFMMAMKSLGKEIDIVSSRDGTSRLVTRRGPTLLEALKQRYQENPWLFWLKVIAALAASILPAYSLIAATGDRVSVILALLLFIPARWIAIANDQHIPKRRDQNAEIVPAQTAHQLESQPHWATKIINFYRPNPRRYANSLFCALPIGACAFFYTWSSRDSIDYGIAHILGALKDTWNFLPQLNNSIAAKFFLFAFESTITLPVGIYPFNSRWTERGLSAIRGDYEQAWGCARRTVTFCLKLGMTVISVGSGAAPAIANFGNTCPRQPHTLFCNSPDSPTALTFETHNWALITYATGSMGDVFFLNYPGVRFFFDAAPILWRQYCCGQHTSRLETSSGGQDEPLLLTSASDPETGTYGGTTNGGEGENGVGMDTPPAELPTANNPPEPTAWSVATIWASITSAFSKTCCRRGVAPA